MTTGSWFSAVLDLLGPEPPVCFLCGRTDPRTAEGACICARCRAAVAAHMPACGVCGRWPGPAGARCCLACRVDPPPYRAVRRAGSYHGLLRWTIRRFKNAGETYLAEPLATLLAAEAADLPRPDVLVPVPPSARRLSRRGYAPTLLLARALARRLLRPVPVAPGVLHRRPQAPPQSGLSRRARLTNAAAAFYGDPLRMAPLQGAVVWLLDDVLTTGATLAACSQILLAGGAREVWGLVVAERAGPKRGRRLVR